MWTNHEKDGCREGKYLLQDNRRLLIKGVILGAILALLIFKLVLPKADGPAEISSVPNQIALQQEAQQPDHADQSNSKQGETVQGKTDVQKPTGDQSGSSGTTADDNKTEQNQPPAKSESEVLPIWLLFRSTTCIPCVEMQKTMDALQPEFKGKVEFIQIDVNDSANRQLLEKFQIRYIPTTYLYDRNKKLYFQQVGAMSVEEMRNKLQALVEVK